MEERNGREEEAIRGMKTGRMEKGTRDKGALHVADQHSGLAAAPPVLGHRQDGPPRPRRSLDPFKVSSCSFTVADINDYIELN